MRRKAEYHEIEAVSGKTARSVADRQNIETDRYKVLVEKIFFDHWKKGATEFEIARDEIRVTAGELKVELPHSFSCKTGLARSIAATHPKGREWIIEDAGRSKWRFRLVRKMRLQPQANRLRILVPDRTPPLIRAYSLNDDEALLAIVRYNGLIDRFLGLTTYSLQNHLRTTVKSIGQIEIDELYIGLDTHGCHYVIPVQAKGGKDQIGIVQTTQDIRWVEQKFPGLRCRAIAAQFAKDGVIALFELALQGQEIRLSMSGTTNSYRRSESIKRQYGITGIRRLKAGALSAKYLL